MMYANMTIKQRSKVWNWFLKSSGNSSAVSSEPVIKFMDGQSSRKEKRGHPDVPLLPLDKLSVSGGTVGYKSRGLISSSPSVSAVSNVDDTVLSLSSNSSITSPPQSTTEPYIGPELLNLHDTLLLGSWRPGYVPPSIGSQLTRHSCLYYYPSGSGLTSSPVPLTSRETATSFNTEAFPLRSGGCNTGSLLMYAAHDDRGMALLGERCSSSSSSPGTESESDEWPVGWRHPVYQGLSYVSRKNAFAENSSSLGSAVSFNVTAIFSATVSDAPSGGDETALGHEQGVARLQDRECTQQKMQLRLATPETDCPKRSHTYSESDGGLNEELTSYHSLSSEKSLLSYRQCLHGYFTARDAKDESGSPWTAPVLRSSLAGKLLTASPSVDHPNFNDSPLFPICTPHSTYLHHTQRDSDLVAPSLDLSDVSSSIIRSYLKDQEERTSGLKSECLMEPRSETLAAADSSGMKIVDGKMSCMKELGIPVADAMSMVITTDSVKACVADTFKIYSPKASLITRSTSIHMLRSQEAGSSKQIRLNKLRKSLRRRRRRQEARRLTRQKMLCDLEGTETAMEDSSDLGGGLYLGATSLHIGTRVGNRFRRMRDKRRRRRPRHGHPLRTLLVKRRNLKRTASAEGWSAGIKPLYRRFLSRRRREQSECPFSSAYVPQETGHAIGLPQCTPSLVEARSKLQEGTSLDLKRRRPSQLLLVGELTEVQVESDQASSLNSHQWQSLCHQLEHEYEEVSRPSSMSSSEINSSTVLTHLKENATETDIAAGSGTFAHRSVRCIKLRQILRSLQRKRRRRH
eukprot:Gregarina_sp_Poly_1__4612@NODE_246_length_10752_cov_151_576135_g216_i0_p1_GENE_NODE_246_length_10752_cov_151_576135_g216_i0NODE_246_length_10752_cov_151_576135_g216_i0_p1_ORF_typecomplete_len801_score81_91_NODE_246_length_10752_cov_151_576135_g216_i048827284